MERKVGEEFDFLGCTLIVEKSKPGACNGCFFHQYRINCNVDIIRDLAGECGPRSRQDGNDIIFTKTE